MRRSIIRSERMREEYIRLEHESGLRILLYPMKGFRTAYAVFGTGCGSIDNVFRLEGEEEYTRMPDGVAHYLEHKLFESEEGDVDREFARIGAETNAFTSFDRTCFLFACTNHFAEALRLLIRFVQTPYFTPETVQKEQGIIAQEIKMYDDNPDWQVMEGLLQALYQKHPIRTDIAGTVESISHITDKMLYRCYEAFYNPANMSIAITGNFDPDEAEKILEEELSSVTPRKFDCPDFEEPAEAGCHETVREMDVSEPLFYFGWKHRPAEDQREEMRAQVVYNILTELLSGPTSDFYVDMTRAGLLNQTFGSEVFAGRGYRTLMFGGESCDPRAVFDAFVSMLEEKKRTGLSEEDFEGCKNALYGRALREINNVEVTANALFSYEMMGISLYEVPDAIASVTMEEIMEALRTGFDPEAGAISIVMPAQN